MVAFISYTLFIFLRMKKILILVMFLLLILTIASACISGISAFSEVCFALIMFLAAFKFLLVAFQFMELKKAHLFWKVSLILTLGLLVVLIIGIK